jgi:hypothetical protein
MLSSPFPYAFYFSSKRKGRKKISLLFFESFHGKRLCVGCELLNIYMMNDNGTVRKRVRARGLEKKATKQKIDVFLKY